MYIFIKLMFIVVYIVFLISTVNARVSLPANMTIPALIVFGDSIVDPGNNNDRKTITKCNFPPYGRDFMGGIPTGRFCNGKVPSDMIADELGVKSLVPAYLDPNLQSSDLLTGVNFASGGSGFDPLTSQLASALSLPDQVGLFKEYIGKLNNLVGEERTKSIISNAVYLLVSSSNDIANTYFGLLPVRKLQYDVSSYTDLMIDYGTTFFKEIYELGARRVAVFSAPPLGCIPSQRTLAGGIQRDCAENYNDASRLYNSKLESNLDYLTQTLPDSKFVYVDIYTPLIDIIQNYPKYGFEVANKGCCGTGTIEVIILCNELSPHTCPDASKYVFWDSYHPSERAYEILTTELVPRTVPKFL